MIVCTKFVFSMVLLFFWGSPALFRLGLQFVCGFLRVGLGFTWGWLRVYSVLLNLLQIGLGVIWGLFEGYSALV